MKIMKLAIAMLLLLLLSVIYCQEDFELSEESKLETLTNKEKVYRIPLPSDRNIPMIRIKVLPKDLSIPLEVFISTESSKLNYAESEYKSIELQPVIFVPKNYYQSKEAIFVKVQCKESCSYDITMSQREEYVIEENNTIEFKLDVYSADFTYTSKEKEKNFQILIQSDEMNIQTLFTDDMNKSYKPYKVFTQGEGYMVYKENYANDETRVFKLSIFPLIAQISPTVIRVIHKEIPEGEAIETVALKEKVMLLLDGEKYFEKCFRILNISSLASTTYVINARSYTQNALIILKDSEKNVTPVQAIDNTQVVLIPSSKLANNESICIKANGDNESAVGIQFQILSLNDLTNSQPYHAPLLSNSVTMGFLPTGGIMYYRLNSISTPQNTLALNIHLIDGEALPYLFQMDNHPYHNITPHDLKNPDILRRLTAIHDINDNFYFYRYSVDAFYNKNKQYAILVHCPETNINGCSYHVTMGLNNERVDLPMGTKVYCPIIKSKEQQYKFNVVDSSVTKINVYLYSYAGNVDLSVHLPSDPFKNQVGTYHSAGNREYIVITNTADPDKPNTLMQEHVILVTNKNTNSYYSVYYTTDKNDQPSPLTISSGEIVTETINRSENKKTFIMMNRSYPNPVDFFTTIISLNCDITINFIEMSRISKERETRFIIKADDIELKNDKYQFEINVDHTDTLSDDPTEDCILRFIGDEIVYEKEILLNEGIGHDHTLDYDHKKMMYIYPMVFPQDNSDYVITLSKKNEGTISISYAIFNNEYFPADNVKMSKYVIHLTGNEIKNKCKYGEICALTIAVEAKSLGQMDTLPYSILVTADSNTPSYIQAGQVIQDMIKTDEFWGYKYYYTDISYEDSGEVVLNFDKGNGMLFAKIVSKDLIEINNNWNHRVLLPTNNVSSNNLKFDKYNNKVIFTQEDTKNCKNAGCELYFSMSCEVNTGRAFYEYSLFIRKDKVGKKTIVRLLENNLLSGSFMNIIEDHAYTIKIMSDTDRIYINLIGDQTYVFAKLGTEIPTSMEDAHWKYHAIEDHMLEIKASDPHIASSSLKGKDITIIVKTKGLEQITSSHYSIKVIVPTKDLPTIVPLTATYNEMCDILPGTDRCHFLFPLTQLGSYNKLHFHVYNDKALNSHFTIFANYILLSDYNAYTPDEIKSKLPTEEKSRYSSANQLNTNHLNIGLTYDEITKKAVILVTVKSSQAGKVSFLFNNYASNENRVLLKPNIKEMINPKDHLQLQLASAENNLYKMEIIRIEGDSSVSYDQSVKLNNNRKSIAMIVDNGQSQGKQINKSLWCLVQYNIRPVDNMDRIYFGRINYLSNYMKEYNNPPRVIFPLSLYLSVDNYQEDISVVIRMTELKYAEGGEGDELFDVEGFVSNESFILNRMKDSTVKPEDSKIVTLTYNELLKLTQYTFTKKEIDDYKSKDESPKYLYVSIKQKESNKHVYNFIMLQATAMVQNSVKANTILPSNQYYFGKGRKDKETVLLLYKNSIEDKIMNIEFSSGNSDNAFTINPNNDDITKEIDYTKSTIEYEVSKANGKQIITIKADGLYNKGIAFAVMKTTTFNHNFAIKYTSEPTVPIYFSIRNNTLINDYNANDNIMTLSFENAIDDQGKPAKVDYVLSYYKSAKEHEGLSIFMNTIPLKTERITVNPVDNKITYVAKDIPNDQFFIGLTAIGKIEDSEQILLYDNAKESNILPNNNWMIYLMIGLAVILTIAVVVLIVLLVKYLKIKQPQRSGSTSDYQQIDKINTLINDDY